MTATAGSAPAEPRARGVGVQSMTRFCGDASRHGAGRRCSFPDEPPLSYADLETRVAGLRRRIAGPASLLAIEAAPRAAGRSSPIWRRSRRPRRWHSCRRTIPPRCAGFAARFQPDLTWPRSPAPGASRRQPGPGGPLAPRPRAAARHLGQHRARQGGAAGGGRRSRPMPPPSPPTSGCAGRPGGAGAAAPLLLRALGAELAPRGRGERLAAAAAACWRRRLPRRPARRALHQPRRRAAIPTSCSSRSASADAPLPDLRFMTVGRRPPRARTLVAPLRRASSAPRRAASS